MAKTLLQQIQLACTDSTSDVATILRLCMVLARKTDSRDLGSWVRSELDGYEDWSSLPDYRVLHVRSYGDFYGAFGHALKNAPIPPMAFDESVGQMIETYYAKAPVSEISALLSASDDVSIKIAWPADLVASLAGKVYRDMNCLQAWKSLPKSALVGILDTVRNRVLEFSLELEDKVPQAGEVPSQLTDEAAKVTSQIFNTTINGDGVNYSAAGKDISMQAIARVGAGDEESLRHALKLLGITDEDRDEIVGLLRCDHGPADSRLRDSKVQNWIGRMIGLAYNGALKVGGSVAASAITKALEQYLNIG